MHFQFAQPYRTEKIKAVKNSSKWGTAVVFSFCKSYGTKKWIDTSVGDKVKHTDSGHLMVKCRGFETTSTSSFLS